MSKRIKKEEAEKPSPSRVVVRGPVTFGRLQTQKVEVSADRGPVKMLIQRAPMGYHDEPPLMRTEFKNMLPTYRRG